MFSVPQCLKEWGKAALLVRDIGIPILMLCTTVLEIFFFQVLGGTETFLPLVQLLVKQIGKPWPIAVLFTNLEYFLLSDKGNHNS